jgi:hypothetical protein
MLIQLTTSFWAQLSMSYFTLFLWSSFRKWVLAKSSIGLGSLPRTISCKKKLLVKHSYIKEFFIKKIYVIIKKILPSTSHAKWMEWIHQYASLLNHESPCSNSPQRIETTTWNIQTLRVGYKLSKEPLWCMEVWNPSKWPYIPSLEDLFLMYISLLFFAPHTRSHATYMVEINYWLR